MTKLRIAPELALPLDIVTQTNAVLGNRGSGKTYAAAVLAEEMLEARQQLVVVDPLGVWWGLRSSADGKSAGYSILILGGEHADVPLEEAGGKLAADFVVDSGDSVILDLVLLRKGAQKRFMLDFAEQLYHRNRQAMHVMIDEADAFAPQRPQRGDERLLGAIEDWVRRGRARGIGVTLITQRSAVLNKNVLELAETLFLFRTTGPRSIDAIMTWVAHHGVEAVATEMFAELPKLPRGEAFVWSPGYLGVFEQIAVRERRTFDSSSTPKPGERRRAPKATAPVDLDKLTADMKASAERAKENDPKQLRARILELEKAKVKPAAAAPDPSAITAAINTAVDRATIVQAREFVKRQSSVAKEIRALIANIERAAGIITDRVLPAIRLTVGRLESSEGVPGGDLTLVTTEPPKRTAPIGEILNAKPRPAPPSTGDRNLSGPQQRMLDVLRSFESLGSASIQRNNLAAFVGYAPTTKAFANGMSSLRSAGLIEYDGRANVMLTDQGRAHAVERVDVHDLTSLHAAWLEKLSGPQQTMLQLLITAYPETITREQLAAAANYALTTKAFANGLSHMRSLGLIDYTGPGEVVATEMLFPAGLR